MKTRPRVEALEDRRLLSGTAPCPGPGTSLFARFDPGETPAAEARAIAGIGGRVAATYPDGPTWIALGRGDKPRIAAARLLASGEVAYAVPDATVHVQGLAVRPDDPSFPRQWGLSQPNNIDIDAPEAWSVAAGLKPTVVAVLDTGVDLSQPDLQGRLWTNPADGTHGYDFINNTEFPQDDNGHGTHVSGIIAAAGNNGLGIAGVAPNARIMPLKFLDSNGDGSTDTAVTAIYYAVAHGANVINSSWGGPDQSAPLRDAIAYAGAHNVVFVTASGNLGTNNDRRPTYPANDHLPNLLSVAAIDQNGRLSSFSNYGARTVDLAAPGGGIVSTLPGDNYGPMSGTSMAAPFVSGVAAMLIGQHPEESAAQIVATLKATVKPIKGVAGKVATGGIVDAARALGVIPITAPKPARSASPRRR